MSDYMAYDPQIEISGQIMAGQLPHIHANIQPILARYGLDTQPNPKAWYRQDRWLEALKDAAREKRVDLVQAGTRWARTLPMPDGAYSVQRMIDYLCQRYHELHRHVDVPHLVVEHASKREVFILDRSPYPDDFMYGIIYGVFSQFMPLGAKLKIRTNLSAEGMLYHITW